MYMIYTHARFDAPFICTTESIQRNLYSIRARLLFVKESHNNEIRGVPTLIIITVRSYFIFFFILRKLLVDRRDSCTIYKTLYYVPPSRLQYIHIAYSR